MAKKTLQLAGELKVVKISDLVPWERNPRAHPDKQVTKIAHSLELHGQYRPVVVQAGSMRIITGHGLVLAAKKKGLEELEARVLSVSDAEADKIGLDDNSLSMYSLDNVQLMAEIALDLKDTVFQPDAFHTDTELDKLVSQMREKPVRVDEDDLEDNSGTGAVNEDAVPELLFPSNNDWGIPTLNSELQLMNVVAPVVKWGVIARYSRMTGTYLLYTDDEKFFTLWQKPYLLAQSGCVGTVEPNFSTGPSTPRAQAVWQVFKKRWLACYWQSVGIRIAVDLNVEAHVADINLLGVPKGWRSYATRGGDQFVKELDGDFEFACEHAGFRTKGTAKGANGSSLLFLVYSGADGTREWCQAHSDKGVIYVPDHMTTKNAERAEEAEAVKSSRKQKVEME